MPKRKKKQQPKKKEYVIIAYSTDEYELPIKVYLTFQEMADDLKIEIKRVYDLVQNGYKFRQTNLKYVKVRCN